MYSPIITSSHKKVTTNSRIIKNSQHLVLQFQRWEISPYTHAKPSTNKQKVQVQQIRKTCWLGSLSSAAFCPEARLWSIRSPLRLIDAKCSSLQLYITPVTVLVWPFSHLIQRFLCKSHILTTWPVPPEHTYLDALLLKLMANIDSCQEKKGFRGGKMNEVKQKEQTRNRLSDWLCQNYDL